MTVPYTQPQPKDVCGLNPTHITNPRRTIEITTNICRSFEPKTECIRTEGTTHDKKDHWGSARRALEAHNKIVYHTVHDGKNALRSISSFTEMLREEIPITDRTFNGLHTITTELRSMLDDLSERTSPVINALLKQQDTEHLYRGVREAALLGCKQDARYTLEYVLSQRNKLNAWVTLLLEETVDKEMNDEQTLWASRIEKAAKRFNWIIESQLAVLKGESPPRSTEPVKAGTIWNEFKKVINGEGVELTDEEELPERSHILCDVNLVALDSVFQNLASNTQDHGSKGGKTTLFISERIETTEKNQFYVLSVRDRGNGITVDPIERIFEQGVTTRSNPAAYQGSGLNSVKTIMEQMGGQVTAHNHTRADGTVDGAVFELWIPVTTEIRFYRSE